MHALDSSLRRRGVCTRRHPQDAPQRAASPARRAEAVDSAARAPDLMLKLGVRGWREDVDELVEADLVVAVDVGGAEGGLERRLARRLEAQLGEHRAELLAVDESRVVGV